MIDRRNGENDLLTSTNPKPARTRSGIGFYNPEEDNDYIEEHDEEFEEKNLRVTSFDLYYLNLWTKWQPHDLLCSVVWLK